MDMIYKPHGRILNLKWLFLVKNAYFFTFFTFGSCGVRKTLQIFHQMSLVFLLGYLEYILIIARIKFKFSIFVFFIGYIGGLR